MDRIDFHLLVDSILDAVVAVDDNGNIIYCNTAFSTVFGWTRTEILNKPITTIIPTSLRAKHLNKFNEYLTTSVKTFNWNSFETLGLKKNGDIFPIKLSIGEFFSNVGKRYFTGLIKDVSDIVEKQQKLEHINDELEHFVYAVSHDVQDPTRLIYSYAKLLLKNSSLSKDEIKMLESIYDTAKRMELFTHNLLTHANTGRKVSNVIITSVEAVNIAIKNLEFLIKETHAEIICDNNLYNVEVDSTHLVQIFQNLLSNSIKYKHKDRTPVIYITTKLMYNYIKFSIKDNGKGIHHSKKDILFSAYQQMPMKGNYKSGIGLAIVKKILNSYGGRMSVASEDGIGTTVYFTLPKTVERTT